MKYRLHYSNRFKKQVKHLVRSGNSKIQKELERVIGWLAEGKQLSAKYRNHKLVGVLHEFYECHVTPDWLLIYRIDEEILVLELVSTGSHAELFG